MSPLDNDCDGRFDEDPAGGGDQDHDGRVDEDGRWESTLSWQSNDSRLGAWSTGDVDGLILTVVQLVPYRVWLGFLYANGANWVSGVVRVVPTGGGDALRGRGLIAVPYTLSYAPQTPLSVQILESGAPLTDGRSFARPVTLGAATSGGGGAVTVTATIDGQPTTLGAAYGVEGPHQVNMVARDQGGQEATAAASFTVDLTAPAFSAPSPADGAVVGQPAVAVSGQVSADAQQVTVAGAPATLGAPVGGWRTFGVAALPLGEGRNDIQLHAVDPAGNATDVVVHVDRDTQPPLVAIGSPGPDTVTALSMITVTGTASDAHLASVTVNGVAAATGAGTFTAEAALVERVNAVAATAADVVGLSATATVSVTRDSQPPVIAVYESGVPVDGPLTLGRPAVFTAQAQDATAVELEATIDGDATTLGTPYGVAGSHTLAVTATDRAGNAATVTRQFTIDSAPPLVEVHDPPPGSLLGEGALTVRGRVSADATAVSVAGVAAALAIPAGDWRAFEAAAVPLAQEGTNVLEVEAADAAGNPARLEVSYVRDTLPPALMVAAPAEGLVTRFAAQLVAGQVDEPHLAGLVVDGAAVTVGADGAFSSPVTLAEGSNVITVTASDTLGHASTVARAAVLDTTAPAITVTAGGTPLADGLLTNQALAPVIAVSDATPVQTVALLNGAAFVSATPVSAEGSYLLLVRATDAAGNIAETERHFRIDTTRPLLAGLAPADGTVTNVAAQTLTGTCDDAAGVTVDGAPAQITAGTFAFPGRVLAEGDNTVTVVATDGAGNATTATLRLTLDSTPPAVVVQSPADGALVGRTSVTVSGTATDAHLDTVTVAGRAAAVAGSAFQADVVLGEEGTTTLPVVARDRAGNATTVTVTVERDVTAPAITLSQPGPNAVSALTAIAVEGTVAEAHAPVLTVNSAPVTVTAGAFADHRDARRGHAHRHRRVRRRRRQPFARRARRDRRPHRAARAPHRPGRRGGAHRRHRPRPRCRRGRRRYRSRHGERARRGAPRRRRLRAPRAAARRGREHHHGAGPRPRRPRRDRLARRLPRHRGAGRGVVRAGRRRRRRSGVDHPARHVQRAARRGQPGRPRGPLRRRYAAAGGRRAAGRRHRGRGPPAGRPAPGDGAPPAPRGRHHRPRGAHPRRRRRDRLHHRRRRAAGAARPRRASVAALRRRRGAVRDGRAARPHRGVRRRPSRVDHGRRRRRLRLRPHADRRPPARCRSRSSRWTRRATARCPRARRSSSTARRPRCAAPTSTARPRSPSRFDEPIDEATVTLGASVVRHRRGRPARLHRAPLAGARLALDPRGARARRPLPGRPRAVDRDRRPRRQPPRRAVPPHAHRLDRRHPGRRRGVRRRHRVSPSPAPA